MASLLNWFGASKPAAPPAAPPGRCLKRVARDVATIRRDHATNLFAEQREAVATTVDCVVCGPEGTPYYGGLFHFRVEHPHSYPVENPTCTNLTTGQGRVGFNPNLYRTGKVCMSILGTWVGPGWNPSHSLSSVLLSIQSLMNDQPYCNEPGREGVARDDPNNLAYDAFLKYATLKFACVDVLDPAKATSAEPLPAAAKRFCAERFDDPVRQTHRFRQVFARHFVIDAELVQIGRQDMFRKTRLLLVQIDGHQLERNRRVALQVHEDVQHGVAVLAAGQAAHDLVAGLDHREVRDRLPHLPAQALLQFVQFQLLV